ncbi:MAG TPA: hypothetical protein VMV72_18540 [Verrucomicrobiae bacterium]|nr:hypothetical protein [Verrucomicrobiae bacterium]
MKPEVIGSIAAVAAYLATVLAVVRFKLWLLKMQPAERALRSQTRTSAAADILPSENDGKLNTLRTSIRRRAGAALVTLLSISGAFAATATCICLASPESDVDVLMVSLGAVLFIPQVMFISWLVATRRFYRNPPARLVA